MLILRSLLEGTHRFGELQRAIPGISAKVLTENLRAMAEDSIIARTLYAEVPPRVEYSLTELGQTMRPVISAMESWGLYDQASCKELAPQV